MPKSNGQDYQTPNKLWVGISPLALIDLYDGASVRLSAETKINPCFSAVVEGGFYLKYLPIDRISPKGFLIKPSIKCYLNKKGLYSGYYLGAEYMYKKIDYQLNDSISINDVGSAKQYPMRRTLNVVSLKFGHVEDWGDNWILELYVGLGVRFTDSKAFGLTPQQEEGRFKTNADCEECNAGFYLRQTGNLTQLNLTAGLKIGYRIL
ncbi:hypothetical protein [Flavobacterium silvaticum]|uniref:DUF3575 domain-containing protein n=1 Tax=Flavobacterium silvaticum TaxID=1852020 RepID=A0A972FSW5_9FLAO|nr:hypothetical protein [Flavobacterium silvaticum]NMH26930.1 hypothetical protein [Flavobacterium silvaticum]